MPAPRANAPFDPLAGGARSAEIEGAGDLRAAFPNHLGIAGESVAGQDHCSRPDVFEFARTDCGADNGAALIGDERFALDVGNQLDRRLATDRPLQIGEKERADALRWGVHPKLGVARVEEIRHQLKANVVLCGEPLNDVSCDAAQVGGSVRVGRAVILGHDVAHQIGRGLFDAGGALDSRARSGNHAAAAGRVADRPAVALDHQNVVAKLGCDERRGQPTATGAHDEDVGSEIPRLDLGQRRDIRWH